MSEDGFQNLRKFVVPEFIFGSKARLLAGKYARNLGGRKALLVTDPGVIKAGWPEELGAAILDAGLKYTVFSDVKENPRDEDSVAGAKVFTEEGCDMLIALGGGSPIDCAKGIGVLVANSGNIWDYEGVDQIQRPSPPIICIPTTCGSSADVSQFAIILDSRRKVKMALISKMLVPDISLIDPDTLKTLDNRLLACTGMDALTHAIEAYVSNASSSVTDLAALEAIRIIVRVLPEVIRGPLGPEQHREKMMHASLLAGMAFSNASLGAVHAMAHALGGVCDLPHGECNAVLLEHVIRMNYTHARMRYREIAECFGMHVHNTEEKNVQYLLEGSISTLRKEVGIRNDFRGEVAAADRENVIRQLAETALRDPCMLTNPMMPERKDIEEIYDRIL